MTDDRNKDLPIERGEPTSSPPGSGSYLPPKLREKLEQGGLPDDLEPKSRSPLPAIVAVAGIVLFAIGGFMVWRAVSKGRTTALQEASADSLRAAARAESLAASVAQAESLAMAARDTASASAPATGSLPSVAGSSASASATARAGTSTPSRSSTSATTPAAGSGTAPRSTQPAQGSATASGSAAGSAASSGSSSGFGLLVGSYIMEDRANSERERLGEATGLTGVVRSTTEGGNVTYDVILGKFGSRSEAERRAGTLVETGKLTQAQVVARPK